MKPIWKWIILFAAGVLLCLWVVGPSESFQRCVKDRKRTESYQALYEKGRPLIRKGARIHLNVDCGFIAAGENTDAIAALAGAAVACFTLVLTVVSIGQWTTARIAAEAALKSAVVAEQAMIYTQRAFLFSDTPAAGQTLGLAGQVIDVTFDVKWLNSGNTAARRVVARAAVLIFEPGMPSDYNYRIDSDRGGAVANATVAPRGKAQNAPLTISISQLVLSHDSRAEVYVVGWIEYSDVFPGTPRRRTEVCWRLAVKADPRVRASIEEIPARLGIDQHGPHNGSDDDCLHKPMT